MPLDLGAEGVARTLRLAGAAVYLPIIAFALAWLYIRLGAAIDGGTIGFDFEGTLWEPGRAILDGEPPYPTPRVERLEVGNPALYPPLLMVLFAPLTVLPWWLGVSIWTALLVASIAGTLLVLGVRDPRCHVLALASAPVVSGLVWGNATLLLVFAAAVAWRWRDHAVRAGIAVGLAIAAKIFLWPLLLWLLGTRRYKAFGTAVAAVVAAVVVPWAMIGFSGLTSYPALLRVADDLFATHSYSLAAILSAFGADTLTASRSCLLVGFVVGVLALMVGRRGRDELAISVALLAAILGSPIVWPYYYALLLVPIAIASPRFSGLWVALALFYVAHRLPRPSPDAGTLDAGGPPGVPSDIWLTNQAPPALWPSLAYATVAVGLVVAASRRPRAAPPPTPPLSPGSLDADARP